MTGTMTEELKAWTFEARPSEDGLCWEIWDTTDHNGGRIGVIDGKGACDDFHAQYAKVCADALTARRFGLSRTPTEAEPGEAEIERVARAIAPRIRYAFDVETMNRASRWETASELLCLIAEDAIAALRSTTPATDVVEAENYASEFVKGEAPADVSRAAVDDDALVERLRGFAAAMRKHDPRLVSAGYGRFSFRPAEYEAIADRLQSLQASIRVKDEALRASAVALNAFIECLGHPTKDREHYRWRRLVTFAEGQAAMEANNAAAVVLGSDQPIGGE